MSHARCCCGGGSSFPDFPCSGPEPCGTVIFSSSLCVGNRADQFRREIAGTSIDCVGALDYAWISGDPSGSHGPMPGTETNRFNGVVSIRTEHRVPPNTNPGLCIDFVGTGQNHTDINVHWSAKCRDGVFFGFDSIVVSLIRKSRLPISFPNEDGPRHIIFQWAGNPVPFGTSVPNLNLPCSQNIGRDFSSGTATVIPSACDGSLLASSAETMTQRQNRLLREQGFDAAAETIALKQGGCCDPPRA